MSSYQDPFEDYKARLAKKLAHKADGDKVASAHTNARPKESDNLNWFGDKVGVGSTKSEVASQAGVGKYLNLNLKRPLDVASSASGGQKKRKAGFGDFEGW